MPTPGAKFATLSHRATDSPALQGTADNELRELENEIASHRDRPISVLLKQVVERITSITLASGAAIALNDHQDDAPALRGHPSSWRSSPGLIDTRPAAGTGGGPAASANAGPSTAAA